MPNPTVAELKKEVDDLTIRVNNLEKTMSTFSKPKIKPRGQRFI